MMSSSVRDDGPTFYQMTHLTNPLRALPLQLPHDVPFVPHLIPDHSRPALKLDLREYVRDTYMCVRGKSKRTEQRLRLPRAALRDVRCSICLVTLAPCLGHKERRRALQRNNQRSCSPAFLTQSSNMLHSGTFWGSRCNLIKACLPTFRALQRNNQQIVLRPF